MASNMINVNAKIKGECIFGSKLGQTTQENYKKYTILISKLNTLTTGRGLSNYILKKKRNCKLCQNHPCIILRM